YATPSHRWGEGEPSLCESTGALGNLQGFCVVALGWNHSRARSNTCCIDKHGTNEVQATMLSMFVWYQRSS
ncbi:hypothetical protein EDD15DRAFT_2172464, partial [Pisolithus albus]